MKVRVINRFRQQCRKSFGPNFNEKVFRAALSEIKATMRLFFGEENWDLFIATSGARSILPYYHDAKRSSKEIGYNLNNVL